MQFDNDKIRWRTRYHTAPNGEIPTFAFVRRAPSPRKVWPARVLPPTMLVMPPSLSICRKWKRAVNQHSYKVFCTIKSTQQTNIERGTILVCTCENKLLGVFVTSEMKERMLPGRMHFSFLSCFLYQKRVQQTNRENKAHSCNYNLFCSRIFYVPQLSAHQDKGNDTFRTASLLSVCLSLASTAPHAQAFPELQFRGNKRALLQAAASERQNAFPSSHLCWFDSPRTKHFARTALSYHQKHLNRITWLLLYGMTGTTRKLFRQASEKSLFLPSQQKCFLA